MRFPHAPACLAIALVAAGLAANAHAEKAERGADLSTVPRIRAYLGARPLLEAAYRSGVEADRLLGLQPECRSQYFVKPQSVTILEPIDLPDDRTDPVAGTWLLRYGFERCGDTKIYNEVFVANASGGGPSAKGYWPGTTLASNTLVRDALTLTTANALLRTSQPACRKVLLADMQVREPPHTLIDGDTKHDRVWRETWTFSACGQSVDVPVTFVPDADGSGTSILIDR